MPETTVDRRRRPFAAIDQHYPWKNTAQRLEDKFGHVGPLAWLYLILAAKRSPVQGEITAAGEMHFWHELGFRDHPGIDWIEFIDYLGRLKQTRKTWQNTQKTLINVQITRFGEWQKLPDSEFRRQRSARKRQENTRPDTGTKQELNGHGPGTERRGEETTLRESPPTGREGAPSVADGAAPERGYAAARHWIEQGNAANLEPGQIIEHVDREWPGLDDTAIQTLIRLSYEVAAA